MSRRSHGSNTLALRARTTHRAAQPSVTGSAPAFWIITVAVATLDRAILTGNDELGLLVSADFTSEPLRLFFGGGKPAGALAAISLDLPSAVLMRHYAVRIRGHQISPIACPSGCAAVINGVGSPKLPTPRLGQSKRSKLKGKDSNVRFHSSEKSH